MEKAEPFFHTKTNITGIYGIGGHLTAGENGF